MFRDPASFALAVTEMPPTQLLTSIDCPWIMAALKCIASSFHDLYARRK
jgi:hypothetical protein